MEKIKTLDGNVWQKISGSELEDWILNNCKVDPHLYYESLLERASQSKILFVRTVCFNGEHAGLDDLVPVVISEEDLFDMIAECGYNRVSINIGGKSYMVDVKTGEIICFED
jgi:hypothetical protein